MWVGGKVVREGCMTAVGWGGELAADQSMWAEVGGLVARWPGI